MIIETNSENRLLLKKLMLELAEVKKELTEAKKNGQIFVVLKIETINFSVTDSNLSVSIPSFIQNIVKIMSFRNGQRNDSMMEIVNSKINVSNVVTEDFITIDIFYI